MGAHSQPVLERKKEGGLMFPASHNQHLTADMLTTDDTDVEKRSIRNGMQKNRATEDVKSTNSENSDELRQPTTEELSTLRKVPGRVPKVAYTLCIVEFGV